MARISTVGGSVCLTVALFSAWVPPASCGDGYPQEAAYTPMFNGKDLTGWENVNCAPGTFFVRDGEIITTGRPTGFLRTLKQYENFIAEFEWMHVNKKEVGNSGFFVWADPLPAVGTPYTRGIEVQVLVNLEKEGSYTSHGDLFSIHGATCVPDRPHPQGWARCLPSERVCKGGGEWNHYKVVARDGMIKLHVNGKEVSGVRECRPRKGYLALESEGAECHFRNLKIAELPSSNPSKEEIALEAEGFKNLFTGLDLSGWQATEADKEHWRPRDWMLHFDGKGAALKTEKEFGDAEFIVDFRCPKNTVDVAKAALGLLEIKGQAVDRSDLKSVPGLKPAGQWNRLHATIKGDKLRITINGKHVLEEQLSGSPARKLPLVLHPRTEMDLGNLFVKDLAN